MQNTNQSLTIWLSLVFILSGCVANNELTEVVEHLRTSNKQALQTIADLNDKDQALSSLSNDRNSQLTRLMEAQVQQHHYKILADLRLMIINANADVKALFDSSRQYCLSMVEDELKHSFELVSVAEQQVESLFRESKKFPNDKTLELQAAKAAADYFGRLNSANSMGVNAQNTCIKKLQTEMLNAENKLKKFRVVEENKVYQVAKNEMAKISATNFMVISANKAQFDALIAWSYENEVAYNNIMMYSKTNNILSTEGVLASAFKGFGNGAIAVVTGKNVAIPSADDIRNSGTVLLDALGKNSQEELSATLLNAKQGLEQIKGNITNNISEIMQKSVMSVLRNKTE